jgi:hypothetical protein
MERKYLFFHTATAAVFQFYAFVVLFLSLFYARLTLDIPQAPLLGATLLYIGVVVFWSFRLDRKNSGKRGV